MDILLLAFALPVATILLAIVLQRVLCNPLLVAATFFAILLIVTFAVFDLSFLVYAIIYTILAYVTAVLTKLVCNLISRFNLNNNGYSCISCNENNPVIVLANENQIRNGARNITDGREIEETRNVTEERNGRSCRCRCR